ncbi:ABC transporter substrate-binding protein [Corynebacterium felinum]|uniref:Ribose transport system substrate-binding protein n=1 Tax=Corynebacterium felinum TaxID=131318 RepID=A0ABU2BBA4_9CORY|nr:ABC transporter substrate-binding protein [Corynebacterium felinum]MDF5821597.1 ABC transporter substrate-binding protein [Corynebacterium felinum]MDR7354649.1 ribose transport system substrate-binding protein [Corynebacterium felinum]WJY94013.1 D-allose-binding periplasmic protein precursor [Corynebacterium felinum]
MNKKLIFTALLSSTALLAACSGGDKAAESTSAADAGASSDKPYIAVVSKGYQHQFWQAVKQGAEKAADELGVTITYDGPDNETQVDKQIQQLQTALSKKPVAVVFAALDSQAAVPLLESAEKDNIPVVAFDSGVDSDIPVATAATDNKAAAGEAAKNVVELVGDSGEVGIICQDQTSTTAKDRRDGFKEYLEKNAPNLKVVDIQYGGGDHQKSADLTKTMLQAHSGIKAMYGCNEGSAVGIGLGVTEAGKKGSVTVVGFDSGEAQMNFIKDGTIAGAVTQDPVDIGYQAVKAAYAASKGEKVEKNIATNYAWYDKKNIDDADIQTMLYK